MMVMTKKVVREVKNDKKSTLSRTLGKCKKWSPARAARSRGAEGHKERL
jgi:hypothetical protein